MAGDVVACPKCNKESVPRLWYNFRVLRPTKTDHICPYCGTVMYTSVRELTNRSKLLIIFFCSIVIMMAYGSIFTDGGKEQAAQRYAIQNQKQELESLKKSLQSNQKNINKYQNEIQNLENALKKEDTKYLRERLASFQERKQKYDERKDELMEKIVEVEQSLSQLSMPNE